MKKAVVFEAVRSGYCIDQVYSPMTVGELKEILEYYDDDTLFILSHDNGFTYGSLDDDFTELYKDENGVWG